MKFIIFVLAMLVCILLVMAYALCIKAQNEQERAERMYIKWKEGKDDD